MFPEFFTMKKRTIRDVEGKEVDVNQLTDLSAFLAEKIATLDLEELSKYGGSYFVWGLIPETDKAVMQQCFSNHEAWLTLVRSINLVVEKHSEGKLEVVLRQKE